MPKKTVTFDAATRNGEPQNAAAAELERELASAEAYDDGFAPRSCPTAGRLLRQPASPTLPAGMTVMQGAVDPALALEAYEYTAALGQPWGTYLTSSGESSPGELAHLAVAVAPALALAQALALALTVTRAVAPDLALTLALAPARTLQASSRCEASAPNLRSSHSPCRDRGRYGRPEGQSRPSGGPVGLGLGFGLGVAWVPEPPRPTG